MSMVVTAFIPANAEECLIDSVSPEQEKVFEADESGLWSINEKSIIEDIDTEGLLPETLLYDVLEDDLSEDEVDDFIPEKIAGVDSEETDLLSDGLGENNIVQVGASSGKCGDKLTWTVKNGVLSISGTGPMYNYGLDENLNPWYTDSSVEKVVISSGVTGIGSEAFARCSSVTSIIMADTVTSIGAGAFDWCQALQEVGLSKNLQTIGDSAFFACVNLKSITLPGSITSIGNKVFGGCEKLTEIKISGNSVSYSAKDGVLYKGSHLILFPAGKTDKSFSVPTGITHIGDSAFASCEMLDRVSMPESVVSIGSDAFGGSGIKSIIIPESVTFIGDRAFQSCASLSEIVFPDSVTTLEDYVLSYCTNLKTATFGKNVASVGYGIFASCSSLREIYFSGNAPEIQKSQYSENNFARGVTATVYYPADKTGWTRDFMQNYGGKLTWIPYDPSTPNSAEIIGLYNSSKGGDLRWKAVPGADKYVIYRTNAGKTTKIATVSGSSTSYMDTSIKDNSWGKVYVYYVCSQKGTSISARSNGQTLQRLAPMKITTATNSASNSAVLKWAVSSGSNKANGYELQYAKSTADLYGQKGTFRKVSINGRNNLNRIISGLTRGQTYYFRVRAYVNYTHSVTGITTKTWSQYSNVVSAKISR